MRLLITLIAVTSAFAQNDSDGKLWSNRGLMQYESHEYATAEKSFRRALSIDKSLFVPNLFLGLDLLELKRPQEAVPYLLAAEKLNSQDTQVLLALGRAYHASFDPARAREWYQRATDAAPRNADAWYGLGLAYFGLAEAASAKLITAFPKSPYVAELKAEAHAEDATADDRFGCFPAASPAHYANDAVGLYESIRAYQRLGVAALTCAGVLEPDSPKMHALLGDAYQRRNMFREAQQEYSKILALDPDNIAGLSGLAESYFADGQLAIAQSTAQKALARDPADGDVNLLMAEILVAEHKYAEAEPCLQRSLHVRPDLLPRVHALLGNVYARTGRPKEAIKELTLGLASDQDGSVYYQLARLYESSGDANAAAAMFEKSKQLRDKRHATSQEALMPVR